MSETEKYIGKEVNLSILSEHGWEQDEKDKNKYYIWFNPRSNNDFSGCQVLAMKIYFAIDLKGTKILSVSYLIHQTDTMGCGRTFQPFRVEKEDDEYAASLLKQILIASETEV